MKRTRAIAAKETYDEIAALVRVLDQTQRRIQELAGDELDSVLHSGGRAYLLHQAQEKLRESEALYHSLFENMLEGCAYCRLIYEGERAVDYIYLRVNHAFEVETGLVDVAGKKVSEALPGLIEAYPEILETNERVAKTGHPEQFELFVKPLDKWFSVSLYSNEPEHFTAVLVNITERKKATEQLQTNEALFRLFIRHTPAAIAMLDTQMRYIKVSQRWMEDYRLTGQGIIGKSHYDVFPDAPERWKEIHQRVLAGAVERCDEDAFPRADGTTDWLQWEVRPWHQAGGEIGGLIMFTQIITARKQAEAALIASEEQARQTSEQLTKVLDSSLDVICTFNAEGRFTQVSAACEKVWGYRPDELLGTLYIDKVHPDDREKTLAVYTDTLSGAYNPTFENRYLRKDGSVVHVLWSASWSEAEQSNFCVAHDITERQQSEQRLQRNEANLAASQRIAHLGSWESDIVSAQDLTQGALRWSDEVFRIWGYEPRAIEVTYENFLAAVHPDDRGLIGEAVSAALREGRPYDLTHRILRPDGTERIVRELAEFQFEEGSGRALRMIGTVHDITDRKQAEESLVESQQRLALATESVGMGIWDWDVVADKMFWDRQMYSLYGLREEDFSGAVDTWQQALHPEDRKRAEADVATALQDGENFHSEFRIIRPNGEVHHIEAHGLVKRAADGTALRMIGVNWDVTERKKLEQQFLRAQRMEGIGTLAGGIAHDLNNMLSPIIMSIELLKMKFDDPASQKLLSIISTSAQRGADMVAQVLTFARGVEGRRMEVQVKNLLNDLEKLAHDTFQKNIQVHSIVPEDLWAILGDPTQLHQVLLNLCVNARDAMPEGGTLTLTAENVTLDAHYAALSLDASVGPYVTLHVEDTGSGMSTAVIEKIFDPFYTTKELGKGTGLGLSTTLAIVKSHGGFVRVYSEVGKGTTFKVYLPATQEKSEAAMAAAEAEMPRGNGELILVVDDELSVRQVTQQTLEAFGYRVIVAADGTEAVAIYAIRAKEIAVVLTDMMMPLMDGPALIRVFRKLNPEVRIIAASGLTAKNPLHDLGVKHFLSKPYTAQTMLKLLRQLLSGD